MNTLVLSALALAIVCVLGGCKKTPPVKPEVTHDEVRPADYAMTFGDNRGAVASVNPLATQAGINALAQGGNAIDAAIAAAVTLGVVDSHNSGIGGGCFALIRLADGRVLALDGREMAPLAATRNMFVRDGKVQPELSKTGALAVGIPGSVALYEQLQKRAGKLSFKEVLLPAAQLAQTGFAIDKTLALRLERTAPALRKFPASAAIYLNGDGSVKSVGDSLVQHDLAQTYRALAENGARWFYQGAFAKATEQWMKSNGGLVTAKDFDHYRVLERQAVRSQFMGYTVLGFPPPSSGGAHVAQILNMAQALNLKSHSEEDATHLLAEIMRRAFADRAHWMGDADFVPVPKGIITQHYADQLAAGIALGAASDVVEHGDPFVSTEALFGKHTTHIAAADAEGNWVAITTTLNTSFGSKVVVPGTGVLLNNQMDDFVAKPGVPNAFGLIGKEANGIEPGKRPLSSMSPTIILDAKNQPVMTLGAAGGPTIISQVAQVVIRKLMFGDSLRQAMTYPRIHHQWAPNKVFIESGFDGGVPEALERKGHTLQRAGSFGGTQAIYWDGTHFNPVTEPRVIARNAGG